MGCSIRAFAWYGAESMQITLPAPIRTSSGALPRLWLSLSKLPRLSGAIVMIVVLTAMGANLLTGTLLPEANQIDLRFRYAPPWPLAGSSPEHLLGTDRLGRDLLSRMLVGAQ